MVGNEALLEETSNMIANKFGKKLTVPVLKQICEQTSTALPGSPPPLINHLDAPNPWKSKFGEEGWEEAISKAVCNASKLNGFDSNCNRDIHCAANKHFTFASNLEKTDERKISVSTPNQMNSSYLCVWDPVLQVREG
eukprot:3731706-Ditylum_brightwellii.AAC.1